MPVVERQPREPLFAREGGCGVDDGADIHRIEAQHGRSRAPVQAHVPVGIAVAPEHASPVAAVRRLPADAG